jgi:hypothetical protein
MTATGRVRTTVGDRRAVSFGVRRSREPAAVDSPESTGVPGVLRVRRGRAAAFGSRVCSTTGVTRPSPMRHRVRISSRGKEPGSWGPDRPGPNRHWIEEPISPRRRIARHETIEDNPREPRAPVHSRDDPRRRVHSRRWRLDRRAGRRLDRAGCAVGQPAVDLPEPEHRRQARLLTFARAAAPGPIRCRPAGPRLQCAAAIEPRRPAAELRARTGTPRIQLEPSNGTNGARW